MLQLRNALSTICTKPGPKTKEDVKDMLKVIQQSVTLGKRLHKELVSTKLNPLI